MTDEPIDYGVVTLRWRHMGNHGLAIQCERLNWPKHFLRRGIVDGSTVLVAPLGFLIGGTTHD